MLKKLLFLSITVSSLIFGQQYIVIGDGMIGDDLLTYVVDNYKTNTTLGYGPARDIMYGEIDVHDGNQLTGVYTGFTIALDMSADPSQDAYAKGINCEHTWPQSMGAGVEPQRSDMHHLFPTRVEVNSARGSDPFSDIPDANTVTWYRLDQTSSSIPANNIDEWSEDTPTAFEVREDHKGNTARAMFYFYTMYQAAANEAFWNQQNTSLLTWHYGDPVDSVEYERTYEIAAYQENNANPFVLDSSLARRIWWPSESDTAATYEGPLWVVDTTGSDSHGDGSPDSPFLTIQAAIQTAPSGDTILVNPGIYYESINYLGKNLFIGSLAYFLNDNSYIAQTVIDANYQGAAVIFESQEDSSAVLNGFTVRNGTGYFADPDGDGNSHYYGGGVYCTNASPSLHALRIVNNSVTTGGGGGLFIYGGSPLIENVLFQYNSSDDVGGAIYCKNESDIIVRESSFFNNHTADVGGAIYARDFSDIILENVIIAHNTSDHAGGGLGFKNNCSPLISAVTIADNFAEHYGAALYSNESFPTLINSILWDNIGGEIYFANFDDPSIVTLMYTDLYGGIESITTNNNGSVNWLEGNIDADPLFCFDDSLDYSIYDISPCAEAGQNGANMGAASVECEYLSIQTEDGPSKFTLHQNYPNPFNPTTTISYQLQNESFVVIIIYDLMGNTVNTLVNKQESSGVKSIIWNATNDSGQSVSAGVYLVQIKAKNFTQTKKMILLK